MTKEEIFINNKKEDELIETLRSDKQNYFAIRYKVCFEFCYIGTRGCWGWKCHGFSQTKIFDSIESYEHLKKYFSSEPKLFCKNFFKEILRYDSEHCNQFSYQYCFIE